jgi:hypothetical protein
VKEYFAIATPDNQNKEWFSLSKISYDQKERENPLHASEELLSMLKI